MRTRGATVVAITEQDMDDYKAKSGVPDEAASCHTAKVEGYVIEGHVPVQAIKRLLADRPDAVGLALPEMPEDAPGMGGKPPDWSKLPVLLIQRNGRLIPFQY